MHRNAIETLIGAVVIIIAAWFVIFAWRSASVDEKEGYTLYARFDRADGVNVGSDVKMSGIKVGTVTNQTIDPETYLAKVTFTVENELKLPTDSSVEIIGDGLLGSKYLAIVPGADTDFLTEGDEVKYTQSSVSLEALIGKFVLGGADEKKKTEEMSDPANPAAAEEAPASPDHSDAPETPASGL